METKNIKITGIQSSEKKITIMQDKLKYGIWMKKKDGTFTKAFEQFQKFGFKVGDTVKAAVNEEDREFTNDLGKKIKYVDRTIAFFELTDENTPNVSYPDIPTINIEEEDEDRIGEILENTRIILEILSKDAPFSSGHIEDVKGEDGGSVPF